MIDTLVEVAPSLADILTEVDAKRVSARQHPDDPYLWIFNYTAKVQYDKLWNPTNMACRGLILSLDGPLRDPSTQAKVVALPWKKFFNVFEDGRMPTSPVVNVTEKMDGSLGILYRTQSFPYDTSLTKYAISTRGSFASEQAIWATAHLNSPSNADIWNSGGRFNLELIPDDWTLLFEIVYPGSHVVVDYPFEGLVLLGIRNRRTGEDLSYADVLDAADEFGFMFAPCESFPDDAVNAFSTKSHLIDTESEGWVLRCQDGTRWKIKGEEYRKWHNVLSRLSERYVIDSIMDGSIDDLIEMVPAPYVKKVETWRDSVQFALSVATELLHDTFNRAPKDGTRKDFALWVMENYPKDKAFLFALYDDRNVMTMLLKVLRDTASYEPLISGVE